MMRVSSLLALFLRRLDSFLAKGDSSASFFLDARLAAGFFGPWESSWSGHEAAEEDAGKVEAAEADFNLFWGLDFSHCLGASAL